MIFNMVGGGGDNELPAIKRARGTITVNSRAVSITGLSFRPVALAVRPTSGIDSGRTYLYANADGAWRRFGGGDYEYADVVATTTATSITLTASDMLATSQTCAYVVLGFEE